jgi:hypothetical protein
MENDTGVPRTVRDSRAIPDMFLAEATPAQRPLLERLLQLYLTTPATVHEARCTAAIH